MSKEASQSNASRFGAFGILIPPLVLQFAAAAKISESSLFGTTFPDLNEILLPVLEVLISVAILVWTRSRLIKRIALLVFILFFCYSLFQVLNGENQCGCFGFLKVDPKISAILDLVCIVFIVLAGTEVQLPVLPRFAPPVFVAMLVAVTLQFVETAQNYDNNSEATWIVLDTENWVGNAFPDLNTDSMPTELLTGHWQVLLYSDQCPDCESIMKYIGARNLRHNTLFLRTSGVEPLPTDSFLRYWRQLPEGTKWVVAVPCFIELEHGIVVSQTKDVAEIQDTFQFSQIEESP